MVEVSAAPAVRLVIFVRVKLGQPLKESLGFWPKNTTTRYDKWHKGAALSSTKRGILAFLEFLSVLESSCVTEG